MAFLHCEIASESLRMATAVDVILPDKGELSEVKTLYLLHGLTDDCTGWTRYTAVERYARERGLAVVLPEVQRSFYTDMAYGLPYFTYVSEELPAVNSLLLRMKLYHHHKIIYLYPVELGYLSLCENFVYL